jgi:hypothetical protein
MATFQGSQILTPPGLFKQSDNVTVFQSSQILGTQLTAVQRRQSENVTVFQSGQILGTQLTAVQRRQSQNVTVFQIRPSSIGPINPPVAADSYRMRGYDSTLARTVYWNATSVDSLGASYGGPGPLTDIVVFMLLGE